jgi:DNA-binding NarL/FixJ family response regulator
MLVGSYRDAHRTPGDRRRAMWQHRSRDGQRRRFQMNTERDKPTSRRWTSDEENELDRLLNDGKEAAAIAKTLNRTRQAIYARLQRLYRKRAKPSAGP